MITSSGEVDGIDLLRELLVGARTDSMDALMDLTVTTANATVDGSAWAGIVVPMLGRHPTRAVTDPSVRTVDGFQRRHGGPSIDVLIGQAPVVHVGDLSGEDRWPGFAAAVLAGTAVRSMLSFRLSLGAADPVGSLTLYAQAPHAFDVASIAIGRRLADYSAAVLSHARELDRATGLQRAVTSNREIGAAVGILMARQHLTRDRAFDLLRDASQHANRPVRDIADDVMLTGDLPD